MASQRSGNARESRFIDRTKGAAPAKPAPRRYSKKIRIIAGVCAAVFMLSGVLCVFGSVYVSSILGLIRYDEGTDPSFENVPTLPGDIDDGSVTNVIEHPQHVDIQNVETRGNTENITNVMLIGVDGRYSEGYNARSDTNIILSVNTATKTVKMASLLRDTWVQIPGIDFDADGEDDYCKLNAAFYYGGFRLLSRTIEQNFHLRIDKYVAVEFEAFIHAVDALGGVDMELTAQEASFIPVWSDDPDRFADNPDLEPLGHEAGTYHLNGQQALAFSRIRYFYADGDFTRQEHQRLVINRLLEKAKTMNFATLTGVLTAVLPYVQTNFSQQELLDYATQIPNYIGYTIERDYSIPGDSDFESAWIGDGLGLWLTEPEQTVLRLHQYLYNEN